MGVNFKAFIFDLDGTIYLGERLIVGADEVVAVLRERGRRVVFLSNKPTDTRETYAAKLTRLGVPARLCHRKLGPCAAVVRRVAKQNPA